MSELFSFLKPKSKQNDSIVKLFDKPVQDLPEAVSDKESEEEIAPPKVLSAKQEYERNQRTVFIGNASKETTKRDLKRHFKDCGVITKIRIRSAPVSRETKTPIRAQIISRDFTQTKDSFNLYAVFKDKESVDKALELNGSELKGRHLRVDRSGGKAGGFKPQKKEDKPLNDYDTTLFLGNLPYKVDQEQLWAFFQECGKIQNVRVIRDRETFLSKGIGYVQMGTKEQMRRAIEKARREEFQNRMLRVKKAAPPERVAKKLVKKEIHLQERRDKKREEKASLQEFQSAKESIRRGGGGGGGMMNMQFVNRVKLSKKKERKIAKEMKERSRSKTLERQHRKQFTGGDEKGKLKEKREKRKKENSVKQKRVEIKKY